MEQKKKKTLPTHYPPHYPPHSRMKEKKSKEEEEKIFSSILYPKIWFLIT